MRLRLNRTWLVLLALLLFVLLLRLPFLGFPFDNDSGAIAYHARMVARGEPLYGTHHPAHHMPGVYYTYAAAFKLFGDEAQSVRILLALWTVAAVYLIYRLGAIAANRSVGLAAAFMAALLYVHPLLAGTTSKIENWVGLTQSAAIVTLFYLLKRQIRPWLYLWVGFFIGLTFMFKVNYIFSPLAITALAIVVELRRNREWRTFLLRGVWIGIGFVVALLPALLYFAAQGLLSRWILAPMLGLTYTQVDAREGFASPIYVLLYPLVLLIRSNPIIAISGLAGVIVLVLTIIRARKQAVTGDLTLMSYIAVWFLLCFVETGVSRTYLNHYYLVFIPSLSLLAAWFWQRLYQDNWGRARPQARRAIVVLLVIVCLSILLFGVRDHMPSYSHYFLRYLPGQESYEELVMIGMPEGVGASMQALGEIADYIDARTEPADTIYYWSNLMQLYYMADRRSAKDIIWPLYIGATGPPEEVLSATYFLVGQDMPLGFTAQPEWLTAGLETNYELETTLHGQAIYRRLPTGR